MQTKEEKYNYNKKWRERNREKIRKYDRIYYKKRRLKNLKIIGLCSHKKCFKPVKMENQIISSDGKRTYYYCDKHFLWLNKLKNPEFKKKYNAERNKIWARKNRQKNRQKLNESVRKHYHKNKKEIQKKRKKRYYENHEQTLLYLRKKRGEYKLKKLKGGLKCSLLQIKSF
jgi:hypothetical protein